MISFPKGLKDRGLRIENLVITEGVLLTTRALEANLSFLGIWATQKALEQMEKEHKILSSVPIYIVDNNELDLLAGFSFHRGMLGLATRPSIKKKDRNLGTELKKKSLKLLCLPEVSDPGNLGTLIRSSYAFGFSNILISEKTCDPFNRKALRASMGATFQMSVFQGTPEALSLCKELNIPVFGACLKQEAIPIQNIVAFDSAVLVLGNEYSGISHEWEDMCSHFITIPMQEGIDSLNVSIAGSIIMWSLFSQKLL